MCNFYGKREYTLKFRYESSVLHQMYYQEKDIFESYHSLSINDNVHKWKHCCAII